MKRTIVIFAVLWLILAGFATSWFFSSESDSRIGMSFAAGRWVERVGGEETLNPASNQWLNKEIAAIDSELPVTTVSYNQYDSAQSSRPGERIMGLPRTQALP